uniref:TSA: Wollemia nobilis Ref_Wollemi_Transcript_9874_3873 transcribed RNA sequence n=1 Tax=Wollemia nobilis TaxID=56998 RepID=A0A0C9RMY1_9CONI
MADNNISETTIDGRDAGESSDATIEIKIKTLDSHVYTLRVNKNMPIPALKEQIAGLTGVPLERQRLICRGKVLKDDQLLSDYHVEDGHTLHLVVRQPVPPPSSSSTAGSSGGDGTSEQQGADNTPGAGHHRIGQVSHNVVFGTFNLQDQGDGGFPDLNRIVATVLNSIGIGNVTPGDIGAGNGPTMTSQGTASEGQNQANSTSGDSQTSNLQQPAQIFSNVQSEPISRTVQMQSSSNLRLPAQDMVIPDTLTTLSQYLNRMVQAFSHDGFASEPHSVTSGNETQDQATASGLPSVSRGLPRPATLGTLIQRTQQLLSGPIRDAFSQLAGLLEGESTVTDPAVRDQIQSVAMHNGLMMQDLGAFLLELGRATLTLRMGQSHDESVVNAGPAVYISSSGPNPIMVQPLPFLQGGNLGAFPTGAVQQTGPFTGGPLGTGDVPRNINIHIHAVTPATNADEENNTNATQSSVPTDQVGNGTTASREAGSVRVVPVRTVVAAVPVRPSTEATNAVSVIYPLLARFQQLNSPQGVPIRGIAQATIEVQPSGIDTAQQQSMGNPLPSILAQMQAHNEAIQRLNFQTQNVDGGLHTGNSSSAPTLSSDTNTHASRNRTVSTTEQGLMQQGSSSENAGMNTNGGDRLRNATISVADAGNIDMSNLVNAVLQNIMETQGRPGRASEQQSDQQQTNSGPSIGSESTRMTDEPKSDEKLLDEKKQVNQSEKSTIDMEPSFSSANTDLEDRDLACTSGNAIGSTSFTSSQPKSEKESLDSHTTVPVGLGPGGLQPLPSKKRHKQNHKFQANKQSGTGTEGESGTDQNSQSSIARGQNVLEALFSQGVSSNRRTDENRSPSQLPSGLAQMFGSMLSGGHTSSGRVDVGDIMSQLLRSPSVNNLLRGVAEQTGTVPPATLQNMMEQVTRSPALRNTMQQVTEQLGENSEELENMLSQMGGGQGSVDFSRMVQQMMPLVSQVLGRASGSVSSGHGSETQSRTLNLESSVEDNCEADKGSQIDLEPTVQNLEDHDPPQEVFRSMVGNALELYTANDGMPNGVNSSDILLQLSVNEDLANEYLALLNRDLITRLQSNSGSADDS